MTDWQPITQAIKLPDFPIPAALVAKLAEECRSWGRQCAGGAGEERGPTGIRYGEPFFQFAEAVERLGYLTEERVNLAIPDEPPQSSQGK